MRAAAAFGVATLTLAVYALPAHADNLAKKDQYLADKAARATQTAAKVANDAALDARIGQEPARLINIYNQWTKEYLAVDFDGDVDVTDAQVNRFLRCRFTNVKTDMDPRLIHVLVDGARKFDSDRVNVVSGFRSPKYNLILQKKGRNVARQSQHMEGHAVDFRIPGVPIRSLHKWVRSLHLGGVGFYTHSRFIHADVGRVRYWTAR